MSSSATEETADGEVMASVDVGGDAPRLIIADVTADESWLSIPADAAAAILEWR